MFGLHCFDGRQTMRSVIKFLTVLGVLAVLFASVIAGTIVYYNGVVKDRDAKISSLNSQIVDLNNELTNLSGK
jgi:outer membrane murein-binding lipoprotein Lpp